MVVVSISPWRGNHVAGFPFSGYLGLSPVVVQGLFRTCLEEDNRALKASQVIVRVRCYEKHQQGPGKTDKLNILYEQTQTLWTKPDSAEYADLGDFASAFRIVLPTNAGGISPVTFKNYKAYWKVEGIVFHEAEDSKIIGSSSMARCAIPLIRHTPLSVPAGPPIRWQPAPTGLPPHRGVTYDVRIKKSTFGASEEFLVDLLLSREDPLVQIRKVHVSVVQHVKLNRNPPALKRSDNSDNDLLDEKLRPSSSSGLLEGDRPGRPASKGLSGVFRRGNSSNKASASKPPTPGSREGNSYFMSKSSSAQLQSGWTSATDHEIALIECSNPQLDATLTLKGVVPRKSAHKWSNSASIKTDIAVVHHSIHVKIVVKRAKSSEETILLESRPITIRSTTRAEDEHAATQAGRMLRVAEAESNLCDPKNRVHQGQLVSHPSSQLAAPKSNLGARRASDFRLTVSTEHDIMHGVEPLPSPAGSVDSAELLKNPPDRAAERTRGWLRPSEKKDNHSNTRRRSEQFDPAAYAGPVRTRVKVDSGSTSTISRASAVTPTNPTFPPSPPMTVRQSIFQPLQSYASPRAEALAAFNYYRTDFANQVGPFNLSPDVLRQTREARRQARAHGPYGPRPRSAGGLSAISQRTHESSGASVAGVSIGSSGSSVFSLARSTTGTIASGHSRFTREQSAPLPTTSSNTMLLLPEELPGLSLGSDSSTGEEIMECNDRHDEDRGGDHDEGDRDGAECYPTPQSAVLSPQLDFLSGVCVPTPRSPTPSEGSDMSDTSEPAPAPSTAASAIDFQSFSLKPQSPPTTPADLAAIAPWTSSQPDVSPFDQRFSASRPPASASAAHRAGSRKASLDGSGGMLGVPGAEGGVRRKSVGNLFGSHKGDDEGGKEGGGRWAFLRRGSKAGL